MIKPPEKMRNDNEHIQISFKLLILTLTLTGCIPVQHWKVFEPIVLWEFPHGTLDNIAEQASWHAELKLCKGKTFILTFSGNRFTEVTGLTLK